MTKSSSIAAIGYERATRVLFVQFRSGGTYAYRDVPAKMFTAFRRASSAGRFFTANIRARFEYVELDMRRGGRR